MFFLCLGLDPGPRYRFRVPGWGMQSVAQVCCLCLHAHLGPVYYVLYHVTPVLLTI